MAVITWERIRPRSSGDSSGSEAAARPRKSVSSSDRSTPRSSGDALHASP